LAALEAEAERDRASATLAAESDAYEAAHREIEGLEGDVEATRSEVFSAINSATALRHSLEHAAMARDRVAELLSKLHVETEDLRIESERTEADRAAAADGLRRAQEAIEATRIARMARESELASARIEHQWRTQSVRAREHQLASLSARLRSLEELQAARAEYGDAARTVLAQANGRINQRGAVADYLEVSAGYERAVEASLGDLLQYVIVESDEYASAGLELVRDQRAGRCGFLVAGAEGDRAAGGSAADTTVLPLAAAPDALPLASVVRVTGPFAAWIEREIPNIWIANTYGEAAELSRSAGLSVATRGGDLFKGSRLIVGGSPAEARGILETKREIKELGERIDQERGALQRLAEETAALESSIAQASSAIAALNGEHHRQEKAVVAFEGQLQRAADEAARLGQKGEQLARERRQAEQERESLDRRQEEGRASIVRLEASQRAADERFIAAQRRLFEAREAAEDLGQQAAQARAVHAAMIERAAALAADVQRLEQASVELDERTAVLNDELANSETRSRELQTAAATAEARLDHEVRSLEELRSQLQLAEAHACGLRAQAEADEEAVRDARGTLDAARRAVGELEVARATGESDLAHLEASAADTVQAHLEEIAAEVAEFEQQGNVSPDVRVICADEPEDDASGGASESSTGEPATDAAEQALTAEEAVLRLRAKIDRLGPVNMMAIEQFDELESRHAFLVTQRQDLKDSIAQTTQAIRRIDETTRQRFGEAFDAINRNFQDTFGTLFGGGRAGLTLLDPNDPLESGIEIIAQPPGKRLQSVQLLSGGEKALTAIALMFGLFKYKPSPFCLLDEIDAPLDDANIGRFVEMLRGMQKHTQFILITHNRKTMEIADRLYGVTMEEPGVSKLISVQLN
jgi:chromosome segregation protein